MSTSSWLYLHPLGALITVVALAYLAALGLRSRRVRRGGAALLRRHARLAPFVYTFVLASWVAGVVSVLGGRHDLDLGDTGHFRVGCYLVGALSAAALLSRWIDRVPRGRVIHPLLGALAVLLASFQVFLGLQIMPK